MPRVKLGSETQLSLQLAQYMQYQHPTAMYHFDYGSGLRMTFNQAVFQKKLNRRAYPDFFLAEPRNGKAGLFLELKKQGTKILRLDGQLVSDAHIREQAAVLRDLTKRGYVAEFAIGLTSAVQQIENYLDLPTGSRGSLF